MADSLNLKLVTPTRKIYEAEAKQLVASGLEGEFTLLPGHDPWMVVLGMGRMAVTAPDGTESLYFANGGFCQVDEDKVVVLTEVCESAKDIDIERAQAAKKRAEERLGKTGDDSIDLLRAEAALKRALYRLDIAGSLK